MRKVGGRIAALLGAAILAGGCLSAQSISISPGYVNIGLAAQRNRGNGLFGGGIDIE